MQCKPNWPTTKNSYNPAPTTVRLGPLDLRVDEHSVEQMDSTAWHDDSNASHDDGDIVVVDGRASGQGTWRAFTAMGRMLASAEVPRTSVPPPAPPRPPRPPRPPHDAGRPAGRPGKCVNPIWALCQQNETMLEPVGPKYGCNFEPGLKICIMFRPLALSKTTQMLGAPFQGPSSMLSCPCRISSCDSDIR